VGSVANPKVRGFYITLPVLHEVGVYSYDANMLMSYVKEVSNPGLATCWAAINKAATVLYTAETVSGTISAYDISNSRTPVLKQHLAVALTGDVSYPAHLKVDPNGKFLYVLDRNGYVHVFDIAANGQVSENHTPYNLNLPAGTVPLGLTLLQK
jgi:DNA-binding beta-propeller fold protein YncE